VPVAPHDGAQNLRCQLTQQILDVGVERARHRSGLHAQLSA
jgi:hypothetical protein